MNPTHPARIALRGLLGVAAILFGAVCVLGGGMRLYPVLKAMADTQMAPDAAGAALGQAVVPFLIVVLGCWAIQYGWRKLSRQVSGRKSKEALP